MRPIHTTSETKGLNISDCHTGTSTIGGTIDWHDARCPRLEVDGLTVRALGTQVRYKTHRISYVRFFCVH